MLTITKNVQQLTLLPQKAIFWQEKQILLLADLHLGKAAHFQKAGIYAPLTDLDDLTILSQLIAATQPKKIYLLGDLFHSKHNQSWDIFKAWAIEKQQNNIEMVLVKGNHDILPQIYYDSAQLKVVEQIEEPPFIFTHIPLHTPHKSLYAISGHIHPAIQLNGKGKQQITLPCFFFGQTQAYLPAFGSFTGIAKIKPTQTDEVYLIAKEKIIKI
jgi:DNA ligase-associated metallophosphoesterase